MKLIKVGLGRGFPAIGAILFNLLVASRLSIEKADIFFFWFTVLYILSFFGRLGFDIYVLRDISSGRLSSATQAKNTAFLVSTVLSIGALFFAERDIWWLLLSLPFFSVAGINSSILRAEGKELLGGALETSLLSSLAFLELAAFLLFQFKIDIELISLSFFLSAAVVFFAGEILVGGSHTVAIRKGLISISEIRSGLRFVPSPLMIYLAQWIAVFFLSAVGSGAVSIYSVAVRLASGFAFVAITIDAFVAPRFAKYLHDGDKAGVRALINSVRKMSILFLGAGYLIYVALGGYFIEWLVGVEYLQAFYISLLVAVSYCFMLFVGPYQYLLLMGGEEYKVALCNGISLIVMVLGGATLWFASVEDVWAYACVLVVSRFVSVMMMRHFSLKTILGGEHVK